MRRPLPEGPLDLLGDIHGEIDALRTVMSHLGYAESGDHPQGRRLVFVGDLVDRGPDSPGVVRWVMEMVERGTALAVMGNHDLTSAAGRPRSHNAWLFDHAPVAPFVRTITNQREREEIQTMLASLPMALEREDLRVVHAHWNDEALDALSAEADVVAADRRLKEEMRVRTESEPDAVERELRRQNDNPIKLLTSGPEGRADKPFIAGNKLRSSVRLPWWETHADGPMVVFGHYSRLTDRSTPDGKGMFWRYPVNSTLGNGRAITIDYSVGSRTAERLAGNMHGPFRGRLAALRWPERELVFDDGQLLPVIDPPDMQDNRIGA